MTKREALESVARAYEMQRLVGEQVQEAIRVAFDEGCGSHEVAAAARPNTETGSGTSDG